LNDSKTEVKLKLKKPIISFNGNPLKDNTNIQKHRLANPTLSPNELLEKCDNLLMGVMLPDILLQIPTQDSKEKLKLFRWATKIEDKMITDKGELVLDLNQVTELYDFLSKSQTVVINVIAPILIEFERLKEELSK